MTIEFDDLGRTVRGSNEELLGELKQIVAGNREATRTSYLDLLSGRQDLAKNLNHLSCNILNMQLEDENQVAKRLGSCFEQKFLREFDADCHLNPFSFTLFEHIHPSFLFLSARMGQTKVA